MHPDDLVCLCFRVSRRKLEQFLRVERPALASRLSECGGAGTGCGWCVPVLRRLHGGAALDAVDAADYAAGRAAYRAGRDAPAGEPESPAGFPTDL